jgi:hypothetical protein
MQPILVRGSPRLSARGQSSGEQSTNEMIIPRPGQPPRTDGQITPIPLLPLRLPPEPLRYPALPSPLRDHRFSATYNVTTHIIPAAFPRSTPFIAPPPAFPSHEIDDEREARIQRYTRELISLQAQYVPDSSGTQPTVLWNVLNRYVRHGKGGGLTLLMLHANGMHKEVSVVLRQFCRISASGLLTMLDV